MPEAGSSMQGPGNPEMPGQSTIEEQLAADAEAKLRDGLTMSQQDIAALGTDGVGSALDAAAAFEPTQSAREYLAADANSSEDGGAGDGNPDVLQMITRPGEASAGSSTMLVSTEITYDQIYASIGKGAQDRNVYELAKKLQQLGYIDEVQAVGQQYYPRKAVAAFQRDAQLEATGRYTRETHDEIFST